MHGEFIEMHQLFDYRTAFKSCRTKRLVEQDGFKTFTVDCSGRVVVTIPCPIYMAVRCTRSLIGIFHKSQPGAILPPIPGWIMHSNCTSSDQWMLRLCKWIQSVNTWFHSLRWRHFLNVIVVISFFFLICFCSKNQNNNSADIKNEKITEILNSKNTNFITNLKICSNINNTQYSQT